MSDERSNEQNISAMKAFAGPGAVDRQLREAVSMCWMMLPNDRRSLAELENELRRLFERVMSDLREDVDAFGL